MPTADGRGYQIIGVPDTAWALQERDAKGVDSSTKDGHLIPLAFSAEMSATQREVRVDQSPCLRPGGQTAVAFSCKDSGQDAADEPAPTLRGMGHADSHENGGGQVAVAIAIQAGAVRENPASGPDGVGVREDDMAYTLEARAEVQAVAMNLRGRDGGAMPELDDLASVRAASGGSSRSYVAAPMAVRRLTPRECERLMGFPDDYTAILRNGKAAADAPRYKALGNSMIVPKMRWVLERLDRVHRIKTGEL